MDENKKNSKFGLIGYPLKHSLSPYIHEKLMSEHNIKGEYFNCEILPDEFEEKIKGILSSYTGFNVTIPFKEKIIKYLFNLSKEAKEFGSVNTVFHNGGYSTDLQGFRRCEIPLKNKKILLVGGGGVARVMLGEAILKGCKSIGIHTRRKEQAENLIKEFTQKNLLIPIFYEQSLTENDASSKQYDVILNATPVGMWPKCEMLKIDKNIISNAEYVFDSIYNPIATRLILTSRSLGVNAQTGLRMLIEQAIEAQKIWNPNINFNPTIGDSLENKLKRKILKLFPMKIVLTGFMGSGKTTIGKHLSQTLKLPLIDLDIMIEEESKMSVNLLFQEKGEKYFRDSERKCLKNVMERSESLILSTGGGTLLDLQNVEVVRKNCGFIVLLDIDIFTVFDRVSKDNTRPLIVGKSKEEITNLYNKRISTYNAIADLKIDAKKDYPLITQEIINAFDLGLPIL